MSVYARMLCYLNMPIDFNTYKMKHFTFFIINFLHYKPQNVMFTIESCYPLMTLINLLLLTCNCNNVFDMCINSMTYYTICERLDFLKCFIFIK